MELAFELNQLARLASVPYCHSSVFAMLLASRNPSIFDASFLVPLQRQPKIAVALLKPEMPLYSATLTHYRSFPHERVTHAWVQ